MCKCMHNYLLKWNNYFTFSLAELRKTGEPWLQNHSGPTSSPKSITWYTLAIGQTNVPRSTYWIYESYQSSLENHEVENYSKNHASNLPNRLGVNQIGLVDSWKYASNMHY